MSVIPSGTESLSPSGLRHLLHSMTNLTHRQVLELADALTEGGAIGVAERMALWDLIPLRQDLPSWVDAMRHPATPDQRIDLLKALATRAEDPDPAQARAPRQALRILRSLRHV